MLRSASVLAMLAAAAATHGYHHGHHHSVHAPIHSHHDVHTYHGQSHIERKEATVNIGDHPMHLKVNFNTHSTRVHTSQHHTGAPGHTQHASHTDEPDVLIQTIKKPIIQKVHEIITPYRYRTTKVEPVHEKVQTHVPQDHGHHHGYGHHESHGYHHGGHDDHYHKEEKHHGYHKEEHHDYHKEEKHGY